MSGLRRKSLLLVCGRPGRGKTTLGINLADNFASQGAKVVYFTIEMSDLQIATKALSASARIPAKAIVDSDFDDDQISRFVPAVERFANGNLRFNYKAGRSLESFESECRRLKRAGELDVVFIDYIQQMRITSQRFPSKYAELMEISARLKELALKLDIGMVGLAQLNREAHVKKDGPRGKKPTAPPRPTMANISECGAIERDADAILLIHRWDNDETGESVSQLILDKNRWGQEGTVDIGVDLAHSRFYDLG